MRIRLQSWIVAGLLAISFGGATITVVLPQTAFAASNDTCLKAPKFLTFPQWYRGLNVSDDDCTIAEPSAVGGLSIFIWRIVLNVIEIGLQLAVYIMVGLILAAGFRLLTSEGQPERARNARNTIIMAAVGMVITIAAVAALNFGSAIFINNP
jgi:hypothetical protein